MRTLDLVVDGLAHVVEQAAELGHLDVGTELRGDDAGEEGCLLDVVQHALAEADVRYFSRPSRVRISAGRPGTPAS